MNLHLNLIYKNELKWIIDLNVKYKNFGGGQWEDLWNLGIGKEFLELTLKAKSKKRETD